MHGRKIPGLSVAVVRKGIPVMSRSYGFANVEVDASVSPSSVFEIGAVSKQFTAAAAMLLVQKGKLFLDAPIRLTMPELPISWTNVTLRHLLSHTSGLPSYMSVPGFYAARRSDISRKAILDSIANLPLRFQPGTQSAVSSTDYFIAGLLVERASGQSYHQFLSDQIFKPLEMTSTRVNDYNRPIERRVTGYTVDDNGDLLHVVPTSPTRLFASGAMVSTVSDLARWMTALASGTVVEH
jgi:CubicO group peptidase (beta-lactamase class C family)